MHTLWNKTLSILLSAFLGFGEVSAIPVIHYEEEPNEPEEITETAEEPEEPSEEVSVEEDAAPEVTEEEAEETVDIAEDISSAYHEIDEKAQEHDYSWRWIISQEQYDELEGINFDSCRILVAVDPAYIYDRTVILSEYNGVYLLQFADAETTKAAYAYLKPYAAFIDVDSAVTIADEDSEEEKPETEVIAEPLSADSNPLTSLNEILEEEKTEKEELATPENEPVAPENESAEPEEEKEDRKVIALIDTGSGEKKIVNDEEVFSENKYVIKAVSMIGDKDDTADDNGHGNKMISYIISEATDADILSIKALDETGKGNASAVYAAIMYAIENEADIINLSVSSPATEENAILKEAIRQAVEKGITVVVAAGNNDKDVKYYTPGNIEEAYTIGAVDENGNKAKSSNYGELMDYAVKAETTSEAAARFTGILYKSSIEAIDASLNEGKVFSPITEKPVEAEPEQDPSEGEPEMETAGGIVSGDRGVTSIDSFDIQFVSGGVQEMYQGNQIYVWNTNRSTKDHGFVYRIIYSTSGVDALDVNEVQIRIPKQILRDREGNFAGTIEMSVPREDEVEESDIENELVYREDGDFYVIYNRRPWTAANEGYIEVAYRTNKPTFDYRDMGPSDDFYATISAKSLTDTPLTAESRRIPVYINTTAILKKTTKKYPTLYKSWQSSWGSAPADAGDYWYLLWEIESYIDTEITQPYDYEIVDTMGYMKGWNDAGDEVTLPAGSHSLVAYKLSGIPGYSSTNTVPNLRTYDKRYDMVITKLDKSVYSPLKRFEVENLVDTELTPIDLIDDPTTAHSSNIYKYERPEFKKPPGHFISWKRADGAYRTYEASNGPGTECIYTGTNTSSTYLGMKGARFTRYDLETLKEGEVPYLDNFDYAAWVLGYAWPWTLQAGSDWSDPENYGIQPVHYELTDETFYLHEDGGAASDRQLTSVDYQIDFLSLGLQGRDARFDEDSQSFVPTDVTWGDSEVVHVYAKFGSSTTYTHVADMYPKTNTVTIIDSGKVTRVEEIPSTTNNTRSQRIFFADNCVGYKAETDNAHYFTKLDTVPNVRLKNSSYVMSTISNMMSIAIDNTSYSLVNQTIGSDTTTLYEAYDTDTDFAREIQRDSYIDKTVVSSFNNVKKKQYQITWMAKMYERYTEGMGDQHYLEQESGTFYDLIPTGLNPVVDSVLVQTEDGYLPASAYDVELISNFRDTGRYMLKVHVKEPADYYNIYFDTTIDWNTITDVGRDVYNPIAYETGNDDIKDGFPDNGGEIKESEIMADLNDDPSDAKGKFLYAEENYDIVAITAGNTGLIKQIKEEHDSAYSYDTETVPNGNYTYRLRYANTVFTSSKNLILFDTLENYGTEGLVGDGIAPHEPDWKGMLQSVDTTQMKLMGIAPVVYVSEVPQLDLDVAANHDITNSSVWTTQADYLTDHSDLSGVKAVAIDCRYDTNGNPFVLAPFKSIMAVLYMKAPATAEADGTRIPETFNNIYLQSTTIDFFQNETDFYIHQDYTAIRFVVKEDVHAKKVSADDNTVAVPNIQFRISGTSDYGTDVSEIAASDRNGFITFDDIEKGTYMFQEYEATPDWLEDHTEHVLEVTEEGNVLIDGEDFTGENYLFEDKPRIHADINIVKKEPNTEITFEEDVWDPETMVKYAVAVYGIEQDRDENGDKMGLTFGPATGADYVNSYKSHTPTGTTSAGNEHHCVHNDSWDEICYWNFVDPYVYEQCVKEGCTHSVNLSLSETLKNSSFHPTYTGDGPSVLFDELKKDNNSQHMRWNPLTQGGQSAEGTNYLGWGGTRVRAMLNGFDELSLKTEDSSYATSAGNVIFPVENYTGDNTLLSAFPQNLQDAIGYKAVKYDSVYNAFTEANLKTSYDKLWLLSPYEMGDLDSITPYGYKHPLEALDDGVYQRFAENGKLTTSTQNFFKGYIQNGSTNVWWLRSLLDYSSIALSVGNYGNLTILNTYVATGVSPGFSLSRNASQVASNMSASGKKASWIERVTGYQATNSRPALNGLIPNTTFELKGTSDYGTDVNKTATSDSRGRISFTNIEKGTYKLKEIIENPDYIKNETEWTVTIDESGMVSSDLPASLGKLEADNYPRYWDFQMRKVDKQDNNIWLQGATVNLKGVSDLGTDVDETVVSDANGKILFENIEKGTYVLTETEAPHGVDAQGHTGTGGTRNYIADPIAHVVKISEAGIVTIDGLTIGATGEYYLENDRAMDGKIKIIKHWIYVDGDELPTPQLTLTSTEPGTEPTYVVTFDANGGHFDTNLSTNVVYITPQGLLNVIKEGVIKTPEPGEDGLVFDGWYKDKEFTQPYSPTAELTDNITVYAKWKDTRLRYAVSVYGIGQDKDQNGDTMGLTFGPATGADYVNSFKRHDATGTTTGGHEHRCIHDDTWDQIIYWNNVDPDVYEQCIGECCTKSVPLEIPTEIKNTSTLYANYTGDGPSTIYTELKDNARRYNAYGPNNGGAEGSNSYDNANGWGGSNIRAVLNGVDDDASDSITTNNGVYARVQNITTDKSLLAAFPQNLQDAIGYKAVKYDPVYNAFTEANLKTSYDKLWLLSSYEMGDNSSIKSTNYQHPLETLDDGVYQRFAQNGKLTTSTQNFFKGYKRDGSAYFWWLRSLLTSSDIAFSVGNNGNLTTRNTYDTDGVSPGFSLSRNASQVASNMSASGKKASWIERVTGYQATNSRPALNGLIPNTTFELKGTSDYGTDVNKTATSDSRGRISFTNIEKGTYKLKEIIENPDYIKNETEWTVTIDESGMVSSDLPASLGR